jgi:hypothetical protein
MREPHLTLGEGLMYGLFLLIVIGVLFFLITLINWTIRVKQRKFYGWLLCLIVLLPVVIIIIGSF